MSHSKDTEEGFVGKCLKPRHVVGVGNFVPNQIVSFGPSDKQLFEQLVFQGIIEPIGADEEVFKEEPAIEEVDGDDVAPEKDDS